VLTSANGGYACGRLASFVDADEVEVTLRLPPPLDRPLRVEATDGRAFEVEIAGRRDVLKFDRKNQPQILHG